MVISAKRLLNLLKAEKNPHTALALFDSATREPGYAHSPHLFHHILRRLIDPKLVVHVSRILELIEIQKCYCPEDVALSVIQAYGKNSMPDKALDVFQRMNEIFGCEAGVRSYNALLNAFVESKQWDRAESFISYFETAGISPNLQTYNILIKILCRKRQFEKAKRFLNSLWEKGLKPDVYSYGTVINGLVKSGDLLGALAVFDEMFERGVETNVVCYNILIDGFF